MVLKMQTIIRREFHLINCKHFRYLNIFSIYSYKFINETSIGIRYDKKYNRYTLSIYYISNLNLTL